MKQFNGDQKGADADDQVVDTVAGIDTTVVVLDGTQKRYQSFVSLVLTYFPLQ